MAFSATDASHGHLGESVDNEISDRRVKPVGCDRVHACQLHECVATERGRDDARLRRATRMETGDGDSADVDRAVPLSAFREQDG